jgi:hypothetical protein
LTEYHENVTPVIFNMFYDFATYSVWLSSMTINYESEPFVSYPNDHHIILCLDFHYSATFGFSDPYHLRAQVALMTF